MEATTSEQRLVRSILSFTPQKPSAEVCAKIANIKDLCEVGASFRSDWRRAPPSDAPQRFHTSSSAESLMGAGATTQMKKPAFRSSVSEPTSPAPVKYQSKFKNSTQPVDDKILNNIILSKLNKFSDKTYNDIRDFLYQILGSGEPDLQQMVRDFMRLVFRKAATEEIFCHLYARLLCEISSRYKVILQEMHSLQANYITIFDDIQDPSSADYATFVEDQKDKRYRHGYSQFLAELSALEILDLDLLNMTFKRILTNMEHFGKVDGNKTRIEEYSDCLVRMAKVLKKKRGAFFVKARATLLETNGAVMKTMIDSQAEYVSQSQKARFILMDVYDILKE